MSRYLDPTIATPGPWITVRAVQTMYDGQKLPTFAVVASGPEERFVGRAHPMDGLPANRPTVEMNTRLFAAAKPMAELLIEAVGFEAEAFRAGDEISGADLLEFFADWRCRVMRVIDGEAG